MMVLCSWASISRWNRSPHGRHKRPSTAPIRRASTTFSGPIAQLGTINSFESESSSVYNGLTISLKRQVEPRAVLADRLHLRKSDRRRAGRTGRGQARQRSELIRRQSGARAQRHRSAAPLGCRRRATAPKLDTGNDWLNRVANGWQVSSVLTYGSGRPDQCDDRGRRKPGWQYLQRSASGISAKRIHRARLLHYRFPSYPKPACRRTVDIAIPGRELQHLQPHQRAGDDQR